MGNTSIKRCESNSEYSTECSFPLYKKSSAEKLKRHEISRHERNDSRYCVYDHLALSFFWSGKCVGGHSAIVADFLLDPFLLNSIITISSSFWCTIIVKFSLSLLLPFSTRSEKYRLSWYFSPYKTWIFSSSALPTIYDQSSLTSLWMTTLTLASVLGFSMPTLGLIWNLLVVDTLNCIVVKIPWSQEEYCWCFWW